MHLSEKEWVGAATNWMEFIRAVALGGAPLVCSATRPTGSPACDLLGAARVCPGDAGPATQDPATQDPATQDPATQDPATQDPAASRTSHNGPSASSPTGTGGSQRLRSGAALPCGPVSFPGYTRPRDHGERLAQLDQPTRGLA